MDTSTDKPLIVIVGPTASGKTSLAIKLAKRFNGEIICADSRTIYRGMNIGTAKPTQGEMDGVPHHMLDVADPGEKFSMYKFQQLAVEYIQIIRKKGKIPFLVGGSGLYVDSILFDYKTGNVPDDVLRKKLDQYEVDDLLLMIKKQQIAIPNNRYNKRHLIRAIEQKGVNNVRRKSIIGNTYVVGITTDRPELLRRIRTRTINMLNDGLIEEAKKLFGKYGESCEVLQKNSYGEVKRYLQGELTYDDLIERIVVVDRQLAKKQMTWFKRNKQIVWLDLYEAENYISRILT